MKYRIGFTINRTSKLEDRRSLCCVADNCGFYLRNRQVWFMLALPQSCTSAAFLATGFNLCCIIFFLPLLILLWMSAGDTQPLAVSFLGYKWLSAFFICRFLVLNKISLIFCAGLKKVRTGDGAFVSRNVLHFVPSIKGPWQSSLLERFISLVIDFRISTFNSI